MTSAGTPCAAQFVVCVRRSHQRRRQQSGLVTALGFLCLLYFKGNSCDTMAASPEGVTLLAKNQEKFSVDLYKELYQLNENMVFCPTSICAALSMLGVGARENTAAQVAEALKVSSMEPNSDVHESFKTLVAAVTEIADPAGVEMIIANTLYMPVGYSMIETFSKTLADKYQVVTQYADFRSKREAAASDINTWIAKQTKNKIKDMVSASLFDENTRLVLVNAVYMKGLWDSQFKRERTSSEPFHLLNGSQRQVDMMYQKGKFRFGYSDKLQSRILEMPYKGLEFSMDIILPDSNDAFNKLEQTLSAENIEVLLSSMGRQRSVFFWLPRFQADVSTSLHEVLPKLGIVDMFSSQDANFSGITGESLYVSAIFHKTFIVVDEEGSEAAAATVAVIQARSLEICEEFRVDRPFLYFIRHIKTGAVLFIGRITSPPESTITGREEL